MNRNQTVGFAILKTFTGVSSLQLSNLQLSKFSDFSSPGTEVRRLVLEDLSGVDGRPVRLPETFFRESRKWTRVRIRNVNLSYREFQSGNFGDLVHLVSML
jgi:hypothetical protein